MEFLFLSVCNVIALIGDEQTTPSQWESVAHGDVLQVELLQDDAWQQGNPSRVEEFHIVHN